MTAEEAVQNINQPVKIRGGKSDHGPHRIPGLLHGVQGDYALVKPRGHQKLEKVPLESVKLWKSRLRSPRDGDRPAPVKMVQKIQTPFLEPEEPVVEERSDAGTQASRTQWLIMDTKERLVWGGRDSWLKLEEFDKARRFTYMQSGVKAADKFKNEGWPVKLMTEEEAMDLLTSPVSSLDMSAAVRQLNDCIGLYRQDPVVLATEERSLQLPLPAPVPPAAVTPEPVAGLVTPDDLGLPKLMDELRKAREEIGQVEVEYQRRLSVVQELESELVSARQSATAEKAKVDANKARYKDLGERIKTAHQLLADAMKMLES